MRRVAILLAATYAIALSAQAQPGRTRDAGGSTHVSGYAIEGRVLLGSADFTRLVSPYVGHGKSASDVEQARRALQQAYLDLGHCQVRVVTSSPESGDGMVTFRLSEEAPVGDCLPAVTLGVPARPDQPRAAQPDHPAAGAVQAPGGNAGSSAGRPHPARDVTAMPYLEGAGTQGLSVTGDGPGGIPPLHLAAREGAPVADIAPAPAPAAEKTAPPAAVERLAQVAPAKPAAGPDPAPSAKPAPPVPVDAPPAPRFAIARYVVEGNTLLRQDAIDRALAPFAGPNKDFGDVQRALEALQLAYQQAGYGSIEVRLPEQELDKGEVKLRVIEPKIGRILVEGNQHFSEGNIRRSVPALREGETPRSRDIAQGVRLANENPAKQSAVVLRASEREDHIDATIRVADVDPKRFSVSLDNTGNEETHPLRLGLAFQHANLFGRDHVITAQFITAPQNFNDVTVFGIGYRIPLYSLGDSVDLIAGYSNVDSGTVDSLFNVSGQGAIYAARYNQNLPRWGDVEHRLTYSLEYRAYQNDVKPVGGDAKLVPDVTVHPLGLTYSGAWRSEAQGDLSYYLSAFQNIPGGSDGRDEHFSQVGARFPDGNADYLLFRAGVTYSRPIAADWQFRVRVDGQYTDDALVSGEMFAIGGADSVRGFNERYTSNDKGYRTSWEIYTPDMAKRLGLDGRLRMLAFYDQGTLRRNKVQPSELTAASLDSGGFGLRMNYKENFTLRLDVAYVFHDGTQQVEYDGKRSSTKGHFSMAWVW